MALLLCTNSNRGERFNSAIINACKEVAYLGTLKENCQKKEIYAELLAVTTPGSELHRYLSDFIAGKKPSLIGRHF
jgi:hypothetical protein